MSRVETATIRSFTEATFGGNSYRQAGITPGTLSDGVRYLLHVFKQTVGTKYSGTLNPLNGLVRPGDKLIWDAIVELANTRSQFRMLELGGGPSYPCMGKQYGSAKISQLACLVVPNISQSVVVDATGRDGWPECNYCVIERSKYRSTRIIPFLYTADSSNIKKIASSKPFSSISEFTPFLAASPSLRLTVDELHVDTRHPTTYQVRPLLDPQYERAISNNKIQAIGETYWQELSADSTLGTFDLAFARHQRPLNEREKTDVMRDLRRLKKKLVPHGKLIFNFDDMPTPILL